MFLGKKGESFGPNQAQKQKPNLSQAKPAEQFTGASVSGRDFYPKIIISVVLAFVLVGIIVSLLGKDKIEVPPEPQPEPEPSATTTTPVLPPGGSLPNADGNGKTEASSTTVKAEQIQFADFYQPLSAEVKSRTTLITLPINVKADVSNYYTLTRKIGLDKALNNLNQNGFAVIPNPFAKTNDFFALHRTLAQKEIPLYVSGNFLLYYHQNVVKNIFKDVESLVFYKELWQVAKYFYDTANKRYLARRQKIGLTNDPILEGERLETAFFAVALELLKPKEKQINTKPDFNQTLFNQNEAYIYKFSLPTYLKDDVEREVELILAAKDKTKSPVFLYQFDYSQFKVPAEYKANAKLNNFYLATKWFNSLFPLYYQSDKCEDCLLDYDDWLRSFIAASFIVSDFSRNQEAKNQWARIYKVISYFKGLRQELTYLHYNNIFNKLWGDNYEVEKIFSLPPPKLKNLIASTQPALAELPFSQLEGSFNRGKADVKPRLGMRILQDAYWPQDYILNQLVEPYVSQALFDPKQAKSVFTACTRKKQGAFRCRGFGLDIINLIYPLSGKLNSDYFKTNIAYQNYDKQMDFLRRQLDNFTAYTWQTNVFWSNLNLIKKDLAAPTLPVQIYLTTPTWQKEKITHNALAAWVNLQVNADIWQHSWQQERGLGPTRTQSQYVLIEPDLVLINELIANTKMLRETLKTIGVLTETDITYTNLSDHLETLEKIKKIINKEIKGDDLNLDEIDFIYTLATGQSVVKQGRKKIVLSFPYTGQKVVESIDGLKLIVVVNEFDGKLVMGVGGVFDYQEGGK